MGAPKGNKYALGNDGGRPPMFTSPEELQLKIDEYFNSASDKKTVVVGNGIIELPIFTICGLALFLGFESRQSFYDYEKHEEYSYIIKKARLKIEQGYEQNLSFNNPAGSIFALKNMGWNDRTELTGANGKDFIPSIKIEIINSAEQVTKEDDSGR